ncbi:hypothetical protein HAX54_028424, partial [Datura stramonium]|nr:hypothetical protein [Datura stramonium]
TLIYDTNFKEEEETTKVMAWISFPKFLPTFYEKEALFSLASAGHNKEKCRVLNLVYNQQGKDRPVEEKEPKEGNLFNSQDILADIVEDSKRQGMFTIEIGRFGSLSIMDLAY